MPMKEIDDQFFSKTETTFQYDKDLLPYPVPDLERTASKYLESGLNKSVVFHV